MRVELTTVVEHDGAEFEFGCADRALLAANEMLQAAAPIMLVAALGLDMEGLAQIDEEELKQKAGELRVEPKLLPAGVQAAFCDLFAAAVRGWGPLRDGKGKPVEGTGLFGADGSPLDYNTENVRDFPTDAKVAVVCEFYNVRRDLAGKGSGLGD